MKKLLTIVLASLFFTACGGIGGASSNSGGSSSSNAPAKLFLSNKGISDPQPTLTEFDVKKAVIIPGKVKMSYSGAEMNGYKLLVGNYDFDPKQPNAYPAKDGEQLVIVNLSAAKDAAEGAPIATGSYEPSKGDANDFLKVGEITVKDCKIVNNFTKQGGFGIAPMGIRNGTIKINSVSGDSVQGSFNDYGAGQFSNIKGNFTAQIVK